MPTTIEERSRITALYPRQNALDLGAGRRIGRLNDRQRQGIGKTLLVAAMEKFLEVFESAGGIGLFVDAKDEAAKAY